MSQRIFSGIQPTGIIHIGNYLGAIKQWVDLQNKVDEAIFCVVDLHAITVRQNPEELRKNTLSTAAWYIASGIDPQKSAIFVQSTRPEHTELQWILNTFTFKGELERMTQYKIKTGIAELEKEFRDIVIHSDWSSLKNPEESFERLYEIFIKAREKVDLKTALGLFNYPILMAADILLYQTTSVPVGEDQIQHVELTRDLAKRFNNLYGKIFTIPEYQVRTSGKRIMGLDDPSKKMSKSAASEYNYIALSDSPDKIRQKIRKAVTDSGTEIKYDAEHPAISNLINIYSEFSGQKPEEIVAQFTGKGYGEFKDALADVIIKALEPIQAKHAELMKNESELRQILDQGSAKITPLAQETLSKVKQTIGLI